MALGVARLGVARIPPTAHHDQNVSGGKNVYHLHFAASLLLFALRTALRASEVIGSIGVITHPLDDGLRAFYAKWGFVDLPFDPRRAMIVRMVDLRKSGVEA